MYNQLTSLKFTSNSAKIKKVADEKLSIINKLNLELVEIIKYDSPEEIVGALELLGRTNAHMNESLLTAPLPPELNKDENAKQQYLTAVSEMAKPFLMKAIESYKGAITKARDLETFNAPYFTSLQAVQKLDPGFKVDVGQEAMLKSYQDWMGVR